MGGLVIETIRPGVEFVPDAAAAFRRADAQVWAEFGRGIDVNSTYRSWSVQLAMFEAWQRYLKGGPYPGHSKALHPDDPLAFHVQGTALDSDDWTEARIVQILAEHGFIRNRLYVPNERHHFEYLRDRDQHYGQTASSGAAHLSTKSEEDDMPDSMAAIVDGVKSWCWLNWGTGELFAVHTQDEANWVAGYMGDTRSNWLADPLGGEKYKSKLALFGILCPDVKVHGASLTTTDLARIRAMLAGSPVAG